MLGLAGDKLQAEYLLDPRIVWERPVDRRKASFALLYVAIKVRCHPIHGADNLVCVKNDTSDDAKVKNAYSDLALALHSLDCDAVSRLHLSGSFGLRAVLPAKHPDALVQKALILVINAAP